MKSICVYCGSGPGNDPDFLAEAVIAGTTIAEAGLTLVYGGGKVGLMGAVADAALAAGGKVIGVMPADLVNQEIGQFVQDWKNSNFDLFVSANGGSPDPDEYFYRTFRTGGSTNVFKYSNPDLDALLDKGRSETDQAARKTTYDEVQKILACDGPAAHIAYGNLFTAVSDKVSGFEIKSNGHLNLLGVTKQ